MAETIAVVQFGIGPIGRKVTQDLVRKPSLRIVGAVDLDPSLVGKDVGELAGLPMPLGVAITGDGEALLKNAKADVAVVTTTSSLAQVHPLLMQIVSHGVHVVSTCEELSYPWLTDPKRSREIDEAARRSNVTVLATGVNPGFLMDLLPIVMTAVCRDVRQITVERIQNAAFRRLPFQQKIGAGLSVEQFHQKVANGTLCHVGLAESMGMIASALGWKLDETEDLIEPIVSTERLTTEFLTIESGQARGVFQRGRGYVGGREAISLIFRAVVGEADPRDRVVIDGTPPIDMTIKNGVNGDVATCAITVNAIPAIMKAKPGLRTMADMPPIAYLGSSVL